MGTQRFGQSIQSFGRTIATEHSAMFSFGSVRHWCLSAFAAGILFSIVALSSAAYFFDLRIHSLVATGTVASVDRQNDSSGYLYCPKFRFQATDGATYTVPCRVWENRQLAVGSVVQIRYRKVDPSDAWPESQVSAFPRDTALWGACSLSLGFALRWYARKRGNSLKLLE